MSTGYGWVGIRQVGLCVTLLGVRHVGYLSASAVREACLQRGAITSVRPLPFFTKSV